MYMFSPGVLLPQLPVLLTQCVLSTSGCTRPPQSQSGAIFFHLNDHCVMFKSARQFWKNVTERYEKYPSDHAFGTLLAKKLAY